MKNIRREKVEIIVSSLALLLLTFLFFKDVKGQDLFEWLTYIVVFISISFFICWNILILNKENSKEEKKKDE